MSLEPLDSAILRSVIETNPSGHASYVHSIRSAAAARCANDVAIVDSGLAGAAQPHDFAPVVSANWSPPAEIVQHFDAEAEPRAIAADSTAQVLVGYAHGRAVCTAEEFMEHAAGASRSHG